MIDATGGDEPVTAVTRSRRAGRPRLMDDAALAEAYRHHLSGLKLTCLGRYYGVSSHYMSAAFGRKGWPVRNYIRKGERAAALAADAKGHTQPDTGDNHE